MTTSRRNFLKQSAFALGAAGFAGRLAASDRTESGQKSSETQSVYRVGAWLGGIDACQTAKKEGLDVVQLAFPFRPGGENDFRDPDVCARYREKSLETGVEICSLAMGEFNGHPFWKEDDAESLVSECIAAMTRLGVKNVLFGFFGEATLDSDDKMNETIRRLKNLAPKAADAQVTLAVESTLDAEGHLRILEGVDSPAVKVYYDPGNMIHRFPDTDAIVADILKLTDRIAEVHAKDAGLLGKGKIDYGKILAAYRKANYFGPQVLEGSTDPDLGPSESRRRNAEYLKSL